MGAIVDLLNQNFGSISRTVDLTLTTVSSTGAIIVDGNPDPVLDQFFPLVNYPDEMLAILKFRSYKPTLGYVVAIDGDIPVDRERITLTQELFGYFKLGKSRMFTEEDLNVNRRAEMLALSGSLEAAKELRDVFLAVPAQLTQGIMNLHYRLSIEVACTGQCNYLDPTTKVPVNLSYFSAVPAGNLAPTLTGNARWSQWATATGIDDIVNHLNAFYTNLRRFPPYIVMSRVEANNLRNQASTKEIVARSKGIITELGTVNAAALVNMEPPTIQDISDAIGKRLIAGGGQQSTVTLIVTDAFYYVRGSGIVGTQQFPYVPAGYYFFAFQNYIERAIVPTASNNFAGGLSTSIEELKKEPPQDVVTVAGRGFPLVPDSRFIAARNVENTAIAA